MTTPLYPTFRKRVHDAIAQLIKQQIVPWSFLISGRPFHIEYFDGRQISYEGIQFEGSLPYRHALFREGLRAFGEVLVFDMAR